jgi:hypothetical protein
VVFHASANAADGNESADGDFVYTAVWESQGDQGDQGEKKRLLR